MKKLILSFGLVLFFSSLSVTHVSAYELITQPDYLSLQGTPSDSKEISVKLTDEISTHIGEVGFKMLRSVNTRDGLIVLLRYFAENCKECKIAESLSKDVLPTNIVNSFLLPGRAVSPTLDPFSLDFAIDPKGLGCLNCIGVHCP